MCELIASVSLLQYMTVQQQSAVRQIWQEYTAAAPYTVAASVPCFNSHLISHAQIRRTPVLSQLVFIFTVFGYFSLPLVLGPSRPSIIYKGFFGGGETGQVKKLNMVAREAEDAVISLFFHVYPYIFPGIIIKFCCKTNGSDIERK